MNTINIQRQLIAQKNECYICYSDMESGEEYPVIIDGEVNVLICWKCKERSMEYD